MTFKNRCRTAYAGLTLILVAVFIGGLIFNINSLYAAVYNDISELHTHHGKAAIDFHNLARTVADFESDEQGNNLQVVDNSVLERQVVDIQIELAVGNLHAARQHIASLRSQLGGLKARFHTELASRAADVAPPPEPTTGLKVPILIYHYTPPDFDAILNGLQQRGYTAITLDDLAAGLRGAPLPAKPVIITFDDGFSNQMTAFHQLQAHNVKATFYIINGGERSHWCIGAARRPGPCGDSYLSWDEVRELDRSGLITIGAHTVDHEALATDSPADQQFEIFQGKAELESQLGHPVRHFAYPYGSFNNVTIALVRQAGFDTAVTTLPGEVHDLGSLYTLRRVRDAYELK
ncbi:MAG TPA: polysaccharide deacetylase family protein [Candidatus Saccharimonadales bacterium]|nr:polysaccharide deacetylase family protein [Candidatus Saccharimonadales bacterium]